MPSEQKPYAAFILTLVGGTLIFTNGLVFILASRVVSRMLEYVINTRGLSLGIVLAANQMLLSFSVVELVLGAFIIFASLMIYYKPTSSAGWGAVVLVLSILSMFVGGGFFIGLILGVIGGSLAIAWRPRDA
jgi:hypothetical protein